MSRGGRVWAASVLTIFPEMFPGPLACSLAGRALAEGRWRLEIRNLRDFATDRHRSVDDEPFGGGAGMVMRPDVLARALDATVAAGRPAIYLTPRGRPLCQDRVRALAQAEGVVLLCGRFEGVDQRIVDARGLEELSIGDVVLSGGEPAAIAVIDACVRLLPGVVGADASLAEESFGEDLLEYPHYTRPQVWEGVPVPEVLLSGHHERIRRWRREQAEQVTQARRPDLWARHLHRCRPKFAGAGKDPERAPARVETDRARGRAETARARRRAETE
jgi:tRNA (guanine37-N1)-methyltransferase